MNPPTLAALALEQFEFPFTGTHVEEFGWTRAELSARSANGECIESVVFQHCRNWKPREPLSRTKSKDWLHLAGLVLLWKVTPKGIPRKWPRVSMVMKKRKRGSGGRGSSKLKLGVRRD